MNCFSEDVKDQFSTLKKVLTILKIIWKNFVSLFKDSKFFFQSNFTRFGILFICVRSLWSLKWRLYFQLCRVFSQHNSQVESISVYIWVQKTKGASHVLHPFIHQSVLFYQGRKLWGGAFFPVSPPEKKSNKWFVFRLRNAYLPILISQKLICLLWTCKTI